jgi:DNA-binding response OmpR family regulator
MHTGTRTDLPVPIRAIIVDDEPLARLRLRTLLAEHRDFELVAECADGREAVSAVEALRPDVIFLDIEMTEVDGVTAARTLHEGGAPPAIVFVTAYDRYAIEAFAIEALDYLLKPFDEERLVATLQRIRARRTTVEVTQAHTQLLGVLRRLSQGERAAIPATSPTRTPLVRVGELSVDLRARVARRGDEPVGLRPKEFDLLAALLRRAGEVMTRRELLLEVWGYQDGVESRTVDTHVSVLRRKLDVPEGAPGYIATVARSGYRLTL